MAKISVPKGPELNRDDYTLGGPGWIDEFGRTADATRGDAATLNIQGHNLGKQALGIQDRAGPTTDFGRSQTVGGQQVGAADWMRDFANGPQGPSAAQAQLRQGANTSMRQTLAAARSGSGFGESAGGLASAQRANADTMASTANSAAQLRAQEDQAFQQQRLQAMGGAANIYGGAAGREGEQAQFLTQADLEAQRARDAMQLGLGQQSIDAQTAGVQGQLGAEGQMLDAQRAGLEGRIAMGNQAGQNYATDVDVFAERLRRDEAQREARRRDRGEVAGVVGQVGAAAASVFSDERTKQKIKSARLQGRYEALAGSSSDSGGGGAEGLAQRDFETYQGALTPRAAARDFGAFADADEAAGLAQQSGTDAPAPLIEGKMGMGLRNAADSFRRLSDERTKKNIRSANLRSRYEALSD